MDSAQMFDFLSDPYMIPGRLYPEPAAVDPGIWLKEWGSDFFR